MIQGFRRYSLTGDFRLRGATNYVWDESTHEAECRIQHDVWNDDGVRRQLAYTHLLEQTCKCGIYIQRNEDPGKGVDSADYILAAVTGWGVGVEYVDGWRMQFARIEHLWIPEIKLDYPKETLEALKERYQVNITVISYKTPTATCCARDHTPELFRDNDGESRTLCKLSIPAIQRYYKLYLAMGHNSFAAEKLFALEDELKYRAVPA